MNKYMELAIQRARKTMLNNEGGPFGAAIIDKEGKIISVASNQVIKKKDPTAHAEIEAIREACEVLGTFDLTGHIIYSTCEPCPMCLSAIIWANIKELYYGTNKKDAENIGFRDNMIYEYLEKREDKILRTSIIDSEECQKIFDEYEKLQKEIY